MGPFRPHLDDRGIPDNHKNYKDGGRGIRTPGTVPRPTVFKTAAFNHSAIPPLVRITLIRRKKPLAVIGTPSEACEASHDGKDSLVNDYTPGTDDSFDASS